MKNNKTKKALQIYNELSKKARAYKESADNTHWTEHNYKEASELYTEARSAKIAAMYAADNIALAMFEEYAPAVLEIFNSYSGKPYGEKTKDKIYNEIKSKLNCGAWIDSRYSGCQTINIYLLNSEGYHNGGSPDEIEITLNNDILDENNKLQETTARKLTGKYYRAKKTQPEKAAAKYLEACAKMRIFEEKHNKEIAAFNNLQSSRMRELDRLYLKIDTY